jgi:hypothetical protein
MDGARCAQEERDRRRDRAAHRRDHRADRCAARRRRDHRATARAKADATFSFSGQAARQLAALADLGLTIRVMDAPIGAASARR